MDTATTSLTQKNMSKIYRYNCVRCNLVYNQIDNLKEHYFDKHINTQSSSLTNPSTAKKTNNLEKITSNLLKSKRKSKRTKTSTSSLDDNEDKTNDDDQYYIVSNETTTSSNSSSFRTNSSITIKRRKLEPEIEPQTKSIDDLVLNKRLTELTEDEMKTYNIENIDETALINEIGDGVYNKKRELLAGRVVWAQWRHIMWPAMIVKVHKTSRSAATISGLKIHIRYYEEPPKVKLGCVFKMDLSKVELFYKCKEHVHYKVLGAINPTQRKEFFVTYTNALKDYIEFKETNKTSVDKSENGDREASTSTPVVVRQLDKKFLVLGKFYTIDEVRNYASKSYTQEQGDENSRREIWSSKLMDYAMSDDCMVRKKKKKKIFFFRNF
jgi:hypothetical protein